MHGVRADSDNVLCSACSAAMPHDSRPPTFDITTAPHLGKTAVPAGLARQSGSEQSLTKQRVVITAESLVGRGMIE